MSDACQITPAEFQLVKILWKSEPPLSVSQVLESIDNGRRPAYTTVMTLLDKLARKGSLTREKRGKAYYYRPAVNRDSVLKYLLSRFADAYFDGELPAIQQFLNGETLRRAKGRKNPVENRKQKRAKKKTATTVPEDEMDVILL